MTSFEIQDSILPKAEDFSFDFTDKHATKHHIFSLLKPKALINQTIWKKPYRICKLDKNHNRVPTYHEFTLNTVWRLNKHSFTINY